jgi:hypothetical protein
MPNASDDLIQKLRKGKAALRHTRRVASLEDKLLALVRAQRMYVEIVGSRRPLKPWERPWDILSDVRDTIIIKDGLVENGKVAPSVSASPSHWVGPHRPWVLGG